MLPNALPEAASAALAAAAADSNCLVEIIELKWLLAGHGVRIHVEQLQHDPEYALAVLDRVARSANPALCTAAARLRRHLGLSAT